MTDKSILSYKRASQLLAPQLVDTLLSLETSLNDAAAREDWSRQTLVEMVEALDRPLWWVNDAIGGKAPGVDFDVAPSETSVSDIDAPAITSLGKLLDTACVRLMALRDGREVIDPARLRGQLLRDVRYAANDVRRLLPDVSSHQSP